MNATSPFRLLDFPLEVRYKIYEYLFAHASLPIRIDASYKPINLQSYGSIQGVDKDEYVAEAEHAEPTFHTALFRVCRAISQDAIAFAYGENHFQLRSNFSAFCGLASNALGSIKDLSVFPSRLDNHKVRAKAFDLLTRQCKSLRSLDLDLPSNWLLRTIPILLKFISNCAIEERQPAILLDLYTWQHYVSFETQPQAYRSGKDILSGKSPGSWDAGRFVDFKKLIPHLPKHVEDITLTSDVSIGELKALEEFLERASPRPPFLVDREMPTSGPRQTGRSRRIWILWDTEQEG